MNKKIIPLLIAILSLTGCDNIAQSDSFKLEKDEKIMNEIAIYAGHINDDSFDGVTNRIYKIKAHVTDTYNISCAEAEKLIAYDNEKNIINENCLNSTLNLKKNEEYYLKIVLPEDKHFQINLVPKNNKVVTPYEINCTTDFSLYNTDSVDVDPLKRAKIEYVKRPGGTYLYSNTPEAMPDEVVNTIIMQNKDLTGECFLTFEHQNRTYFSPNLYLGYRLRNTEDHDIYVTVSNVGYQVNGSWVGEKSWMDYYGVKFDFGEDKFKKDKFYYDGNLYSALEWSRAYLNFDTSYIPNPIEPITYKIPADEYFYVIGGTSEDAYKHININNTANQFLTKGNCANGNVRFSITNGKAIGELCVYDNLDDINSQNVKVQNLRRYGENDDYGGRIGYSPINGVIDNNPVWEFNDLTSAQLLPISYENYYADTLKQTYEPFEPIENCYYHQQMDDKWRTNLSAQLSHNFCGSDMVEHHTICDGKEVVLSNYIANPAGKIWDFGNWMIEYQDNCTFVNKGDKDRTVKFYINNGSSIFYIIKELDNTIIKAGTLSTICSDKIAVAEVVIPAHSIKTISAQFVLPANTMGGVEHYIQLV